MRHFPWLLGALLFFPLSYAQLITEVHPNPASDESLNEWVELFNEGDSPLNMSGWSFGDSSDNDTIEGALFLGGGTIIPPFGFAILTDEMTRVYENFNVSSSAIHLYVDDAALGNGLSNNGETIFLYSNGTLIAFANYSKPTQGLSSSLVNGSWRETLPSPGLHANGTIPESAIFLGCDYEVQLILNGSIFPTPDAFSWRLIARKVMGESTNITARATIQDFFGNVKQTYAPFTNQSISTQRTSSIFSPNLEEGKSYILSTDLTTQCQDGNTPNNHDERIFTILGKLTNKSSLSILSVLDLGSDGKASFGQTIRVRINAYRGDTTKETITAWIEHGSQKLTKQSRAGIEQKFSNMTLTLPLQIVPNCDGEHEDDTYTVKAEGLDEEDEEDVEIDGLTESLCKEAGKEETTSPPSSKKGKITFQVVELPPFHSREESSAKVRIENSLDEQVAIELWSYIYRGSKSYSGEREENKRRIVLMPQSTTDEMLPNTPLISEDGMYRAKYLLKREDQKTSQDLTFDIDISGATKSASQSITTLQVQEQTSPLTALSEPLDGKTAASALSSPEIAFSSSGEKAKDIAPLILIITLTLLVIALILRR